MDDIREQIETILHKANDSIVFDAPPHKSVADVTNQILNIKCSRGGVCPECKGKGRHGYYRGYHQCLTCKGTGQKPIETKTVNEILEGWENGS